MKELRELFLYTPIAPYLILILITRYVMIYESSLLGMLAGILG